MIRIRNKKTGEVKEIEESQLGSFGLAPQVDPTATPEKVTAPSTKITVDQLYKMSLDPKIKPATYTKIKQLYDLQQEADKKEKLTTDEIKLKEDKQRAEELKNRALETVDELLQLDTGAITGLKNPLKSLTGENAKTRAKFDMLMSLLSLENVKFLKGQGQVSEAERDLLKKAAASLNTDMTNEDFYNELLKIKGSLSGRPVDIGKKKSGGLLDTLTLGISRRLAQDVGVGAGMNLEPGTQQAFDDALNIADRAEKKAMQVTDPKQKAALLKVAQDTRATVSKSAKELSGKFSEDINKGYGERAFGSAVEIAGAAELPAAVSAVRSTGTKLISKAPQVIESAKSLVKPKPPTMSVDELLSGVTKSEAGKKVRTEAIEKATELGKKVDGTKVYRTIEKQLKSARATATPSETKQIDELIRSANKFWNGKQISPKTAKVRWDNAMSSFKASGIRGDSVKSLYDDSLRNAIRKQLDKVAPGFEAGTKQIAEGIKIDKLLKPIRNARDRKLIKEALEEQPSLLTKFIKKASGKAGDIATGAVIFGIMDFLKGRKKKEGE